jgi:hypothetical protein
VLVVAELVVAELDVCVVERATAEIGCDVIGDRREDGVHGGCRLVGVRDDSCVDEPEDVRRSRSR